MRSLQREEKKEGELKRKIKHQLNWIKIEEKGRRERGKPEGELGDGTAHGVVLEGKHRRFSTEELQRSLTVSFN
jgi:hypothetical protein